MYDVGIASSGITFVPSVLKVGELSKQLKGGHTAVC